MSAEISLGTVAVVLGMAVVTLATKAGGYVLVRRVELPEPVERWLEALPGAIVAAILAPELVGGDPASAVGAVVTAVVAWRTGSVVASLGAGLVAVLAVGTAFG